MQYSVQSVSNLIVTPSGPGGNKLVEPKAYLDLEEFLCVIVIGRCEPGV